MDLDTIRAAKQANLGQFFRKPNVVAVGIGYKESEGRVTDRLSIIVSVSEKIPSAQLAPSELVPPHVHDVPTDVQQLGVIRANQSPKGKFRPAPGGVSIGHIDVTAGTFGCLVYRGSQPYILSNNHVLANSNRGRRGDAILQPGKSDGGTTSDQIAVLEDFVQLTFGTAPGNGGGTVPGPSGCLASSAFRAVARALGLGTAAPAASAQAGHNLVDCAIARPLSPSLVENRILNIGQPHGVASATLNTQIVKSGRTTGFTTGSIKQVDVTVQVEYSGVGAATFSGQLVASPMSEPGDSGSAVLDIDGRVVGLLFAGSDASTMITPIQQVLTALNVTIPA